MAYYNGNKMLSKVIQVGGGGLYNHAVKILPSLIGCHVYLNITTSTSEEITSVEQIVNYYGTLNGIPCYMLGGSGDAHGYIKFTSTTEFTVYGVTGTSPTVTYGGTNQTASQVTDTVTKL